MAAIDVGRVCKKLSGREAGRYCVIIGDVDENYIQITGPKDVTGVKRRSCNILHVEPTPDKIDIKKGATDQEVKKALESAGLLEKVTLKAVMSSKPASEKK